MAMKYIQDLEDETGTWVQPARLVKLYGLSRTTIWRLLNKMRGMSRYQNSFRDISYNLRVVKLADFDTYLLERGSKVRKGESV